VDVRAALARLHSTTMVIWQHPILPITTTEVKRSLYMAMVPEAFLQSKLNVTVQVVSDS